MIGEPQTSFGAQPRHSNEYRHDDGYNDRESAGLIPFESNKQVEIIHSGPNYSSEPMQCRHESGTREISISIAIHVASLTPGRPGAAVQRITITISMSS